MGLLLESILFFIWSVYLLLCPFTKVEESFNVQAIHDILFHQLNVSAYDHLEFPGVVPRTFIGPVLVSCLAFPFIKLAQLAQVTKHTALIIARLSLGLLVFMCFKFFVRSVRKVFGSSVANWLIVITCCQFHFNFYATRPLPNVFALACALLVFGCLLSNRKTAAIWSAVFSVVVCRSELVLLYAPLFLPLLWQRKLTITQAVISGLCAFLTSLMITVLVDSFFWQKLLWPEGRVWYYNVVLNKSSDWGTSPFLWYFYSALPRALLCSLLFACFGPLLNDKIRYLSLSALMFIFLYSFLPHKELRFIIYTVPIFNLSSAYVCNYIFQRRRKSKLYTFAFYAIFVQLIVNILATSFFLYVSMNNYPGGEAMMKLHQIKSDSDPLRVHIDVYNAQTGISRFLHLNEKWEYNKSESLKLDDLELLNFDCVLVGEEIEKAQKFFGDTFQRKIYVNSFKGLSRKITSSFPFIVINVNWSRSVGLFCVS